MHLAKIYFNTNFHIVHPEEKYEENHMNSHAETPNGETSPALESQRLIQ